MRNSLKKIIFVLAILLIATGIKAQTVIINDNCKDAYSNILSLKFEDAQLLISAEKIQNPSNIYILYLENYIDFLKVTISEDQELFQLLKEKVSVRINKIEKLDDTSVYKKYLIGNINLQWATARVKFGEYATAAFEINRAYRLLELNNEEFPEFMPNSITLGILHIMIGIIPDSYNWILNLISMHGDVIQGQNELKFALEECENNSQYIFLKDEVLFYMGMINLSLNPDKNFGNYLLSKLKHTNNKNLLLKYLAINTNMKMGNNKEALKIFSTIDTNQNYYTFYYLNYLHGECLLRNMNTTMAKQQFKIFLNDFTGQNYIKRGWQKTGWANLIEGDTASYQNAMHNVLSHGNTNIDADKNAESTAKSKTIPNIDLLKCRLLFDGGYYFKARSILKNINYDSLSSEERAEVSYRFGRIEQRLDNTIDAKIYYKQTIETSSSFTTYYVANSALLLGNIYEVESDTIRAIHYYNVCLSLEFNQYRNSIRGKAKQGLNRVSNISD
jgi:tetratricopeptide (TPR) repeat protein